MKWKWFLPEAGAEFNVTVDPTLNNKGYDSPLTVSGNCASTHQKLLLHCCYVASPNHIPLSRPIPRISCIVVVLHACGLVAISTVSAAAYGCLSKLFVTSILDNR